MYSSRIITFYSHMLYNTLMKKIGFENINQKNIFFVLSEPNKDSKKIVIMSHGFRGSSLGPARTFVNFEKLINENSTKLEANKKAIKNKIIGMSFM